MQQHTAKQFVLQLGSLASLYLSLAFLLVLLFGVINVLVPDATDSYWQINSYDEQIRWGIAMVVVFFPTYLILTRLVNKNRRMEGNQTYLDLTRWLIYLSLLGGGAVLLGDLVAVIWQFLDGEITARFILKSTAVLGVIGGAFYYYVQDARDYWLEHEAKSKNIGLVVSAIAAAIVVAGFMVMASPQENRERKLDQQQIEDLREVGWAVDDYLNIEMKLPNSLKDVYKNRNVPTAPTGRPTYRYQKTEKGYQLCAEFAYSSSETRHEFPARKTFIDDHAKRPYIVNQDDWYFEAGDWCFEREVRYPETSDAITN